MAAAPTMTGRAWLELLGLGALWGASFLAMEIAARELGPMTVVLHRVGWAAVLLWVVVLRRGIPIPRDWRIWAALGVMGLLNNVIPFGLIVWGQNQAVETGLAAILNAMTAPLTVLVAALILADERLTARRSAGVALAFAGVVVIKDPASILELDPRSLGQLAVLGAALSYAFAGVWGRSMLKGLSPVLAAAGMLTGSTLISFPIAVAVDGWPSFALAGETWAAIGYVAVLATAAAYLLYYRVLAVAGAGNLLLVTMVVPPIAALLGWIVLSESLGWEAGLGFALIALGLAVIDGRVLRIFHRKIGSTG